MSHLFKPLGLVMLMALTACANPAHSPTVHDFGAGVNLAAAPNSSAKPHISVSAPTWLWDNRIRYRLLYSAPTTVRFYGLDVWVAPPPELFEQFLLENLPPNSPPLSLHLMSLEQEFTSIQQANIVLRFELELKTSTSQATLSKIFSLRQPSPTPDAAGAINAMLQVNQLAVAQITAWLAQIRH